MTTEIPKDIPVVSLNAEADRWGGWYRFGELLDEQFPGQAGDDLAMAMCANKHPDDVVSGIVDLVCEKVGERDEENWIWLVTFGNGKRYRFDGWCDYTGWDCRSGLEWEAA